MSFFYAVLPALVAADFADFVKTAKDVTADGAAHAETVDAEGRVRLTFMQHMATFWDRNSPYDFVPEFFGLLLLVAIGVLYFRGVKANEDFAKRKFQALYRQLHDNFAQVGLTADSTPLAKDGPDLFLSYATGRKNVQYLHLTMTTFPRHDMLLGLPLRTLYGLYFDQESIVDRLTVELRLPAAAFDAFVFGIVNKNVMRVQRQAKWDLTFTKTSDAAFSNHFVIMSEVAEVTDRILGGGECAALVTQLGDALEYFVVSDQPTTQPKTGVPDKELRTIRFSVLLAQPGATDENLNALLAFALDLADNLPRQVKVTANGQRRLALAREETYKAIAKQIAAEQAEEAPKRLTRKEIRDKEKKEAVGKLSAKEQKRALEKERERNLKKSQSKMSRKA